MRAIQIICDILDQTWPKCSPRAACGPPTYICGPWTFILLGITNHISPFIQIWTRTVDISSQYASKKTNFFPALQELSLILKSATPDKK